MKNQLFFIFFVHLSKLIAANDVKNYTDIVEITVVGEKDPFASTLHWDSEQNVLYYVNSVVGDIIKLNTSCNTTTTLSLGFGATIFLPVRGSPGQFLVSVNLTYFLVEWDGESSSPNSMTLLFSETNDATQFRFNSGKADKNGVLFTGTVGNFTDPLTLPEIVQRDLASVYKYQNLSGTCTVGAVISPASGPIGIAWSPDNTLMYYIDVVNFIIEVFDYDLETAQLSNRRPFFNITENGFVQTGSNAILLIGLTVDCEGYVWASIYGLGVIIQISPDGILSGIINLPVSYGALMTWGGEDLSTLYVSSVSILLNEIELQEEPLVGSLFAINGIGTSGIPGGDNSVNVCSPVCDGSSGI